MAEEEPLTLLVLEILRRRRRATLRQILEEIFITPREREIRIIMDILTRLEMTGAVVRHVETITPQVKRYWWYYARPIRELVVRRPGKRMSEKEISEYMGIPLEEVPRIVSLAVEKGWLRTTPEAGIYEIPEKIYRVQKMKAWKTDKKPELYQVKFQRTIQIPQQLVIQGFADKMETDELSESVHGAIRIVVYTASPERWTEERLERIMRGLFAQEGITLEIYSDLPHIHTTQAYEVREVDIDEKPREIGMEEVDIWLWVAKEEGYTVIYHYRRRPWGWEYEKFYTK